MRNVVYSIYSAENKFMLGNLQHAKAHLIIMIQ